MQCSLIWYCVGCHTLHPLPSPLYSMTLIDMFWLTSPPTFLAFMITSHTQGSDYQECSAPSGVISRQNLSADDKTAKTDALSKGDELLAIICSGQPHSLRHRVKGPATETLSKCRRQLDVCTKTIFCLVFTEIKSKVTGQLKCQICVLAYNLA